MTLKNRITKAARACVPLAERVAFADDDEELINAIVDLRTGLAILADLKEELIGREGEGADVVSIVFSSGRPLTQKEKPDAWFGLKEGLPEQHQSTCSKSAGNLW